MASSNTNVLFVDDEVNILNSLKRGLIDEDYRCFFASSGKEALKIMQENNISVIVSDMRMPEMDGLTLLKIVKEEYPKTVRIVLSGYMQLPQILATVNHADIFKFVTKPWDYASDLELVIRQAINYYNLQEESDRLKSELEQRNNAYKNILKSMDNVVKNTKRDSDIVKNIGILVLDYIEDWVKAPVPRYSGDDTFAVIKALYREYLLTIAADIKEFKLRKIIDEIEGYLLKRKFSNTEISWEIEDDYTVKDNYSLYIYVFKAIIKAYLNEYTKLIKISAKIVEDKKDSGSLECIIMIANPYDDIVVEKIMEKRNNFINEYMSEILKSFEGSFKLVQREHNIAVKFQIKLRKV